MTTQKRAATDTAVGNDKTGNTSQTFSKCLLANAERFGNRAAIREKRRGIWHTLTWRALAEEASAIAVALAARGLVRGARIAFLGDNRPRFYIAMHAAHMLGAVAVPLYQDASADEIAPLLQHSQATHVFAENQEQVDKILKILPRCPSILCIVYDKDRGMRHYKQPQLANYADMLRQGKDILSAARDDISSAIGKGRGEDEAFLFFTSGTTGPAKAIVFTNAALIERARAASQLEGLGEKDVSLAYLPPGWIGQAMTAYAQPLVTGMSVACPESSETVFSDMREIGPTYLLATPRVLETLNTQVALRLADSSRFNQRLYRSCMAAARRAGSRILAGESVSLGDRLVNLAGNVLIYGPLRDVLGMSRLRMAYAAGDALSPDLLLFYRALGVNLKQTYGSTETGFFVTVERDGDVCPSSAGTPLPGTQIAFGPGDEILVRSPGLLKAYRDASGANVSALDKDGWFHTGDAGYFDDAGHLRIVDRVGDKGTLTDGTPVAPKQVESHLKFSAYINEAVVFADARDNVSALVDLDMPTVSVWADGQGIAYTGQADLSSRPEVYALISDVISGINEDLACDPQTAGSQITRFAILPKELDADDGLLTRTGKPRRKAVSEKYAPVIDAIYSGGAEAALQEGEAVTKIRIGDARRAGANKTKKAA